MTGPGSNRVRVRGTNAFSNLETDSAKNLYVTGNQVLLSTFDSATGYTAYSASTGTLAAGTDHVLGAASLQTPKVTHASAKTAGATFDSATFNLGSLRFEDQIVVGLKINDITNVASASVVIGTSASHNVIYTWADTEMTASTWMILTREVEDFTSQTGNGWDMGDISYVAMYVTFDASTDVYAYIYWDSIYFKSIQEVRMDADIEIGAVEIKDGASDTRLNVLTQDSAFGTTTKGLPIFGKYQATPTTYSDGDAAPILLDANGRVALSSDIEIGAVELKDGTTDVRSEIIAANAGNTVATNVLKTQVVDTAGGTVSTTNIESYTSRLASSGIAYASAVTTATTAFGVGGQYNAAAPTMTDTHSGSIQLDVNGRLKVQDNTIDAATTAEGAAATKGVQMMLDDGTDGQFAQCDASGFLKVTSTGASETWTDTALVWNSGKTVVGGFTLPDTGGSSFDVSSLKQIGVTLNSTGEGTATSHDIIVEWSDDNSTWTTEAKAFLVYDNETIGVAAPVLLTRQSRYARFLMLPNGGTTDAATTLKLEQVA